MITTEGESERFNAVVDFVRENNIITLEDLEERLEAISKDGFPEREEIRKLRSQIGSVEGLLEYGDLRESLDSIHDEYMKIHWKGKKEKYAKEHSNELEAWKIADKYMRKNLPSQDYKREELGSELSSMYSNLYKLRDVLEPREEEARILSDVSAYVTTLLPELVPEGEALTPEQRQEKMIAIKDRLVKASSDSDKRAKEYLNKKKSRRERDDR